MFLICSSLRTASFYHVYQQTTLFMTCSHLQTTSFCHDYRQASVFLIFFPNERLQFAVSASRPRCCGTYACSQISLGL
jgi:hypothetical protein